MSKLYGRPLRPEEPHPSPPLNKGEGDVVEKLIGVIQETKRYEVAGFVLVQKPLADRPLPEAMRLVKWGRKFLAGMSAEEIKNHTIISLFAHLFDSGDLQRFIAAITEVDPSPVLPLTKGKVWIARMWTAVKLFVFYGTRLQLICRKMSPNQMGEAVADFFAMNFSSMPSSSNSSSTTT